MSTTHILSRKGTASILGTLIFVSIIFSAFIPMMLVMRQADTLYDMNKHEMEILGAERTRENIVFYTLAQGFATDHPPFAAIWVCEFWGCSHP